MGRLRDRVRERLDGMAERQAQRDAARAWANWKARVLSAKYDGRLVHLSQAKDTLKLLHTTWVEERVYGMTLLATDTGLLLAYSPGGVLDRPASRILHPHHFQEPLFTAETSASPSA